MKNTQFSVRQTAGNNEFLKSARATWNDPIYKEVLRLYNLYGKETAERYLQRFTKDTDDDERYREQEAARSLKALQKAAAQTRLANFSRLARLTNELRNEVWDTLDEADDDDEALEIANTLLKQIESCFRRRA